MSNNNHKNKIKIEVLTKAAGVILLAAGLFVTVLSLFMNLFQYSVSQKEIEEYKNKLAELQKEETIGKTPKDDKKAAPHKEKTIPSSDTQNEDSTQKDDALYILRIPRIDSENLVREGTARSVLADSLGHESGTSYIGEGGNCVIAGHRNYSFGKFFNRLGEVEVGDEIFVDTPGGTQSYKVTEVKVVEPEQVEILEDAGEEQLTLYTCTPIYIASHRLVIIAKPV